MRESVDQKSAEEGQPWSRLLKFDAAQIEYVKGSTDFIGLNYYSSRVVSPAEEDIFRTPSMERDAYINVWTHESWKRAKSEWLYLAPNGLYKLLNWIRQNYNNIEIIITENGWSDDGQLDDVDRIDYMKSHFEQIHRAIEDGCNVTGHATWSIIDNFEWLRGYT